MAEPSISNDSDAGATDEGVTLFSVGVHRVAVVLISVAAFAAAIVHTVDPGLTMDTTTLGLIAIALIPWLGYVLQSLKLPGGLELEFQRVKQQAADAKSTADNAKNVADSARGTADNAVGAAQSAAVQAQAATSAASAANRRIEYPAAPGVRGVDDASRVQDPSSPAGLDGLVREYDDIRRTQRASDLRTSAMTDVFGRMMAALSSVNGFDVKKALDTELGGARLAGYAYVYTHPRSEWLPALIDSISQTDPKQSDRFVSKPFEQYWGIVTLGRVLGYDGAAALSAGLVERLEDLLSRLRPGTDRYHELARILGSLNRDSRTSPDGDQI